MDDLTHVGVLGMKWGVRKSKRSADSQAVREIRKKKVDQLSNEELKKLTTRLQLEKQFKDLTKKDYSRGQKIAGILLAKFGPAILKVVYDKYVASKFGSNFSGFNNSSSSSSSSSPTDFTEGSIVEEIKKLKSG